MMDQAPVFIFIFIYEKAHRKAKYNNEEVTGNDVVDKMKMTNENKMTE